MHDHHEPSTRRLETRARLLDAAVEVFAEEGVQGASVEAICDRAHFSRGAFYSNFSSKDELFMGMLEREFTRRAEHIKLKVDQLKPLLSERTQDFSPAETARIIVDFFLPTEDATAWLILETEFLLMTMRNPEFAPGHHAFMTELNTGIGSTVETVLHAAGRTALLPINQLLSVLTSQYEVALKTTVLAGADAPGGLGELGDNLATLVFALTRSAHEVSPA